MVVEEKYPEVEDVVKDYDEICKICDEMGNFMEQRKNDRTRAGFTAKFNVPFEKTADCIMKEKFPQHKKKNFAISKTFYLQSFVKRRPK